MTSRKILFLHGAGVSTDKNITSYLQEELHQFYIQSYSFDFSGHGESKVPLNKSSLKRRCIETKKAIRDFHLTEPLTICGSSMGGYIAIKLLEEFCLQNLILFCPAVYDTKAFDVPFDERFTEIIRAKDSWGRSDAFDILKNFTGKALIFIGENDDVIPDSLIFLLNKSLEKASYKKIVRIPGCPHKIHRWLCQNQDWKKKVAGKIHALFI